MKLLLQVLAICPLFCWGTITEITSIDEVKILPEENVLYIFDIDNTLIHLIQELGSDQWFYQRIQDLEKMGKTSTEAQDQTAAEFYGIQQLSQSQIVEKSIPHFIEILKEKKLPFMGLTIRGFDIARRTIQQLSDCGVELDGDVFDPAPHFIEKSSYLFSYKGVVFTSGGNKGVALQKFLSCYDLHFDHVVMVDDKRHHLEGVEKALEEIGISMTGYRYGFLDEYVARFCPDRAKKQFSCVEPLIEGKVHLEN
ncbi:MAG: DUF2608 domain-containing protein [Chlamydiia bacterium]